MQRTLFYAAQVTNNIRDEGTPTRSLQSQAQSDSSQNRQHRRRLASRRHACIYGGDGKRKPHTEAVRLSICRHTSKRSDVSEIKVRERDKV